MGAQRDSERFAWVIVMRQEIRLIRWFLFGLYYRKRNQDGSASRSHVFNEYAASNSLLGPLSPRSPRLPCHYCNRNPPSPGST